MFHGLWSWVYSLFYGLWFMVYGLWFMVRALILLHREGRNGDEPCQPRRTTARPQRAPAGTRPLLASSPPAQPRPTPRRRRSLPATCQALSAFRRDPSCGLAQDSKWVQTLSERAWGAFKRSRTRGRKWDAQRADTSTDAVAFERTGVDDGHRDSLQPEECPHARAVGVHAGAFQLHLPPRPTCQSLLGR